MNIYIHIYILKETYLEFNVYAAVSGVRVGRFYLKDDFNGWKDVLTTAQNTLSPLFEHLELIDWRCMSFESGCFKRIICHVWPPVTSSVLCLVMNLKSNVLYYFSF